MNIKILNPNEANSLVSDADLVLVDIRNYGGFYVSKNSHGAKNFVLPADYLGLFITSPNLIPSFTLTLPTLALESAKAIPSPVSATPSPSVEVPIGSINRPPA